MYKINKNRISDYFIKSYVYLMIFLVLGIIFYIIYFLGIKGIKEINLSFLTENPKGMPLGSEGGVKGAIIGSFLLMILSSFFSIIFGFSCAVYNVVYCKVKIIKTLISLVIQCMASIPSIIIGLFVYGYFIVTLNIPLSMLTASLSLTIMVIPFVELRMEKYIQEIENIIIRDSYSLGIETDYMCKKLLFKILKEKIISTGILAGCQAIGATAPLLLTGAVFVGGNSMNIMKPVMALPFHLHMLLGQGLMYEKAYATAFVLICILIIFHVLAEIIMLGIGEKIIEYIRNKRC